MSNKGSSRIGLVLAGVMLLAGGSVRAQSAAAPPAGDLRFGDFFRHPVGPAGLEMTPTLRAADGQRVRLTGYMVAQEQPLLGHLFLTPLPVSMSEPADGAADDLPPATVLVELPEAERDVPVLRTQSLLQLTGTLRVGRHAMADGRVVWVRLQLDPRRTAPPSLSTPSSLTSSKSPS